MTIVTAVPQLWPVGQLQPSAPPLSWQTSESPEWVKHTRCPFLVWYISPDGWSCCPPHWYSARLRCWATSLTLNGYLLQQSPPASGAQRGSVSGRRGWMELPSGRASQPQSDSQTATAHIPSLKWTAEPMGASGQVRQTQAYWEAAREGRMEGRYCSCSQLLLTYLNFSLLCWENTYIIKYQIKLASSLSLYVSCLLLLSFTSWWLCPAVPLRYWESQKLQRE